MVGYTMRAYNSISFFRFSARAALELAVKGEHWDAVSTLLLAFGEVESEGCAAAIEAAVRR